MKLHKILKISDKRHAYGVGGRVNKYATITTQEKLVNNFISVFGLEDLTILCDNVLPETITRLESLGIKNIIETKLGPHDSTLFEFNKIISDYPEEDAVYMCEDDYWHLLGSDKLLLEGLRVGDYVTLYDSRDKYINGGLNPLISEGGETTRVLATETIHWKYTNATTMTFAATVKTFKDDIDLLRQHYTADFNMFMALWKKGKKLINCIPGRSAHIGYEMGPHIDWDFIISNELNVEYRIPYDVNHTEWKEWGSHVR